ncbi:MAG: nucleoside hydrolase [Akkermansiaceae bacterium]|nr:nucleoside hydrolase [Akkermansiaceae bacterium]
MKRVLVFLAMILPLSPASAAEVVPRLRVIVDNDFGGDPDGLFQLAHLLLSPAVEVRGVIASRHHAAGFYGFPGNAAHGRKIAADLVALMDRSQAFPLVAGSEESMETSLDAPLSEAATLIRDEALRKDDPRPLFVLCGGGLTDVALALRKEPLIEDRLTVVWIGGPEHPGTAAPPPGKPRMEYNLSIDPAAGRWIFGDSKVRLWQVPRNTYRQALVSHAELRTGLDARGKLGGFLWQSLVDLLKRADGRLGEAYVLGDNPLVLLTALQSSWEPDAASSVFQEIPAPGIDAAGNYVGSKDGRMIRVCQEIDMRLMMADFFAKVAEFDAAVKP